MTTDYHTQLKKFRVCVVAYANYFTDARIKNYVQSMVDNGHEVDVFALGDNEPCPPGLNVFCLQKKVISQKALPYLLSQLWFIAVSFIRIGLATIKHRYELVHVHNMPDFIVLTALIPKLFGAKVILDIHDTMPEAYATKMDIPLTHPLIGLIRLEERISISFSDHVITTNSLHREALIEHKNPGEKISIIMNVGNEKIFNPQTKTNHSDGLTLAYHGTIAARLGLDLILDAIHQALPVCPKLKFIIIGDGEFLPKLITLMDHYKLGEVIELKGWVPVESLPNHLSTVDVGIIGNRKYTEAHKNWMLPVKMLEYTAMEIPSIAPRLRVIQEYFNDNSAFYYKPDDPLDMAKRIIDLYQSPKKIEEAKIHLRKFNEKYNWTNMKKNYLTTVSNLVGKNFLI